MSQNSAGKTSTGIDTFIDFLKKRKDVSMQEAVENMGVSEDLIQKWVDFLTEDGVVVTHYKFMKPFITYIDSKGRITSSTERKIITQIRTEEKKLSNAIKTNDTESAENYLEKIEKQAEKIETEPVKKEVEQEIVQYKYKLGKSTDKTPKKPRKKQKKKGKTVQKDKYQKYIRAIKKYSKTGNLTKAKRVLIKMKHDMERDPLSKKSRVKLENVVKKIQHHLGSIKRMRKQKA